MNAYENESRKPMIEVTNNAFKIILPNINVLTSEEEKLSKKPFKPSVYSNLSKNETKALEIVKNNGFSTRKDIEEQLEISSSTASRLLRTMQEKQLIVKEGKGRNLKYILVG